MKQIELEIAALIVTLRNEASALRAHVGVPCQSENAWHIRDYERWADLLQRALDTVLARLQQGEETAMFRLFAAGFTAARERESLISEDGPWHCKCRTVADAWGDYAADAPLQPRAGEPQEHDQGAALLPADPSAAVQTEALPNSVRRGEHGKDCIKVAHWRHGAFLHPGDHDGPYEIDNVQYCGRCHAWMGTQIVVVGSVTDAAQEPAQSASRSEAP